MKLALMHCITGKIERIVFQNPDNGYAVLNFAPTDESLGKVTVVGYFSNCILSGQVTFEGNWQTHPTHGKQFLATTLTPEASDVGEVSEMLLMKQLEGIGPSFAQKLWKKFGEKLADILSSSPEQIKEVPGIGKQRYQKIVKSWEKYKSSHEAMLFLVSHHISINNAIKICDRFAKNTIETITQNPYCLIENIEGIGFQTADNFAQRIALTQNDPRRIKAGIHHTLQQITQFGHCGAMKQKLIEQTARLLQIHLNEVATVLESMIEDELIEDNVKSTPCVFSPELYEQERQIAEKLKSLLHAKEDARTKKLKELLEKALEEESFPFSEEQISTLKRAIEEKVFVMTGGPGVGKTTLVRWLVNVFSASKMQFALAAPTGRAAKRLSEVTGHDAKTIHRLLEYDPYSKRFRFNQHFTLPIDVIILDEVSMIDVSLMASLLQAIPVTARLIMVGDADQLASVGPGDMLRSVIQSDEIPYHRLKTIFRQKGASLIVENAHRINQGEMPNLENEGDQDFYWVDAKDAATQQKKLIKMVTERIPQRFGFDPNLIQVLCPTNEGPLGVNTINNLLQATLNPSSPNKMEVKHRDRIWREGDKVIQVVNDYEKNIFNGDIGRIANIHVHEKKLEVLFDQETIEYSAKEWDQLKLAYAITIHKSQGSEYPAVVVMFSMLQKMMLTRNLLYTAVSRGKSCVVVLCDKMALQHAVHTQTTATRVNKLEEWLRDEAV